VIERQVIERTLHDRLSTAFLKVSMTTLAIVCSAAILASALEHRREAARIEASATVPTLLPNQTTTLGVGASSTTALDLIASSTDAFRVTSTGNTSFETALPSNRLARPVALDKARAVAAEKAKQDAR
jgi:hypothetical protein